MAITRLRLARFGCRNRPFYRIVAIDARRRRDAKPIEYVGSYDPLPQALDGMKEVRLRVDRIKYWLGVGAQPSDRVAYLLWRVGLMPMPPVRWSPTAWIKKSERPGAKKRFHTLARASSTSSTSTTVSSSMPAAARGGLFASPLSAARAMRPGSLFAGLLRRGL